MRKSQDKELKERKLEILKKDKEFNNKMNFLKDKENSIEKKK